MRTEKFSGERKECHKESVIESFKGLTCTAVLLLCQLVLFFL